MQSGEVADPLVELQRFVGTYAPVQLPELPRFFGGAVGYLGYDMVRFVEELPALKPAELGTWDCCFLITENLLIFDSMRQKIKVVSNVHLGDFDDPGRAYDRGDDDHRRPGGPAAGRAPGPVGGYPQRW